jgi:hypothetical protein
MDETTFPYRVDDRTRAFLATLVSVMDESQVRFASHTGGIQVQFLDKGTESATIDAPVAFLQEGLRMVLPMNAVAKTNPKAAGWLRKYHQYLENTRREQFTPLPTLCKVTVEAKVDGRLEYYLTYMVAHSDDSPAQNTPQGKLYATEPLYGKQASKPAGKPASKQRQDVVEEASWMDE